MWQLWEYCGLFKIYTSCPQSLTDGTDYCKGISCRKECTHVKYLSMLPLKKKVNLVLLSWHVYGPCSSCSNKLPARVILICKVLFFAHTEEDLRSFLITLPSQLWLTFLSALYCRSAEFSGCGCQQPVRAQFTTKFKRVHLIMVTNNFTPCPSKEAIRAERLNWICIHVLKTIL